MNFIKESIGKVVKSYFGKWTCTQLFRLRNALLFPPVSGALPLTGKKVSVVIPTLSKGIQLEHLPMLRRLLAVYLPGQTHTNYEAIVYCDGCNGQVVELVKELNDPRIRLFETERTLAAYGHPQTRMGVAIATGDYFVRLNDDNKPGPKFLEHLLAGQDDECQISYGRVIFCGDARKAHAASLRRSFVVPGDGQGRLKMGNIDCMNYMVRMDVTRKFIDHWDDSYAADWNFLNALIRSGVKAKFIDRIIGDKC